VKAQIDIHKLRGDVRILEGSGNNVAVLTGANGKVFVDAAITATKPRIPEAANSLSVEPALLPANGHRVQFGCERHQHE